MTDAHIPGKWLSVPMFAEMPDHVFGFLARALAQCAEGGTDGFLADRWLGGLHADGMRNSAVYAYLENVGLWDRVQGGYQFRNWDVRPYEGGLGQSSNEYVQSVKRQSRERQRRFRQRQRTAAMTHDKAAADDEDDDDERQAPSQ